MILIPLWMAFWSRAAGGGPPKLPWIVDQLLYALPVFFFTPLIGWWVIIAYVGTVAGKVMGTRQYLDMGNDTQPIRKTNNVDFLIKWLDGKITPYWYDFIGNSVMGVVSMLPLAVLVGYFNFWASIPLIVMGASRGLAYFCGWKLIPNYHNPKWPNGINYSTQIAEILAGAFIGAGIVASIIWANF